jgi:hypothetical protein
MMRDSLLLARLEIGEFLYASNDPTLAEESMGWFALAWMHNPSMDENDYIPNDGRERNEAKLAIRKSRYLPGWNEFKKILSSGDAGRINKVMTAVDGLPTKYGVKLGRLEEEEHAAARVRLAKGTFEKPSDRPGAKKLGVEDTHFPAYHFKTTQGNRVEFEPKLKPEQAYEAKAVVALLGEREADAKQLFERESLVNRPRISYLPSVLRSLVVSELTDWLDLQEVVAWLRENPDRGAEAAARTRILAEHAARDS